MGSFYPGFSGRATATVNGTITAFKVRAEGPTTMTFRLVKVRHVSSNHKNGQAKAIDRPGPTVNVQGPGQCDFDNGIFPIETFHAHMKVQKGEEIAIDTTSNTAGYCSDGTPGRLLFDPHLAIGQNLRSSHGVDGCLMLVQAVVKH